MRRTILLCGFVMIFSVALTGQERSVFVSAKGQYGFIIPHASAVRPLSDANPTALQLEVSKLNDSDKSWQVCNCYGRDGLALSYVNFGNSRQLGNAYGLAYFAEAYLSRVVVLSNCRYVAASVQLI